MLPPGKRIYAIGDVHGEGPLLSQLLRLINADNDARCDADTTLVFLGDFIDRGPDAVRLLESLSRLDADNVVILKGNHEDALVNAYRDDHQMLSEWLPFGAATTLVGFGITDDEIASPAPVLAAALRERIDPGLIEWLDRLPSFWECGDYYFAHAGIKPGVKLQKQNERDLLWIREPFLSSPRYHGKVIVHGHTIEAGLPMLGGNRIGLDTGAHENGVLTALGLEGRRQWLLQATTHPTNDHPIAGLSHHGDSSIVGIMSSQQHGSVEDIDALIARITEYLPDAARSSVVVQTEEATAKRSFFGRRFGGIGSKGYAAAGFALLMALIGIATIVATKMKTARPQSPGVDIAIPDAPENRVRWHGVGDAGAKPEGGPPTIRRIASPSHSAHPTKAER